MQSHNHLKSITLSVIIRGDHWLVQFAIGMDPYRSFPLTHVELKRIKVCQQVRIYVCYTLLNTIYNVPFRY